MVRILLARENPVGTPEQEFARVTRATTLVILSEAKDLHVEYGSRLKILRFAQDDDLWRLALVTSCKTLETHPIAGHAGSDHFFS
jgi:hypothetical protein